MKINLQNELRNGVRKAQADVGCIEKKLRARVPMADLASHTSDGQRGHARRLAAPYTISQFAPCGASNGETMLLVRHDGAKLREVCNERQTGYVRPDFLFRLLAEIVDPGRKSEPPRFAVRFK